jgi:hypothetical protein
MVQQANLVTQEARDCAASAGADHLLPLILLYESRTSLDLHALTNMKGGRLKSHHEESGEYADELKDLDTALTNADSTRALLMPHGANTDTSALLDLIQDACDLYAVQSAPGGGSGGGGSIGGITTSAADIAAAVSAVSEANKLESSKECTTTYEQGRHAIIVGLYKIALGEEEHGNRNALIVHPWVVARQGEKWRLCHDYSVGLNQYVASAPFILPTPWSVRPVLRPGSRFA